MGIDLGARTKKHGKLAYFTPSLENTYRIHNTRARKAGQGLSQVSQRERQGVGARSLHWEVTHFTLHFIAVFQRFYFSLIVKLKI